MEGDGGAVSAGRKVGRGQGGGARGRTWRWRDRRRKFKGADEKICEGRQEVTRCLAVDIWWSGTRPDSHERAFPAQCAVPELVLIKKLVVRVDGRQELCPGDSPLPSPSPPVPEPVADERRCAQRFGGNGQKGSNHRGILPCGQLGCTGDLVTNCPFFSPFGLSCLPPSYSTHPPTPSHPPSLPRLLSSRPTAKGE